MSRKVKKISALILASSIITMAGLSGCVGGGSDQNEALNHQASLQSIVVPPGENPQIYLIYDDVMKDYPYSSTAMDPAPFSVTRPYSNASPELLEALDKELNNAWLEAIKRDDPDYFFKAARELGYGNCTTQALDAVHEARKLGFKAEVYRIMGGDASHDFALIEANKELYLVDPWGGRVKRLAAGRDLPDIGSKWGDLPEVMQRDILRTERMNAILDHAVFSPQEHIVFDFEGMRGGFTGKVDIMADAFTTTNPAELSNLSSKISRNSIRLSRGSSETFIISEDAARPARFGTRLSRGDKITIGVVGGVAVGVGLAYAGAAIADAITHGETGGVSVLNDGFKTIYIGLTNPEFSAAMAGATNPAIGPTGVALIYSGGAIAGAIDGDSGGKVSRSTKILEDLTGGSIVSGVSYKAAMAGNNQGDAIARSMLAGVAVTLALPAVAGPIAIAYGFGYAIGGDKGAASVTNVIVKMITLDWDTPTHDKHEPGYLNLKFDRLTEDYVDINAGKTSGPVAFYNDEASHNIKFGGGDDYSDARTSYEYSLRYSQGGTINTNYIKSYVFMNRKDDNYTRSMNISHLPGLSEPLHLGFTGDLGWQDGDHDVERVRTESSTLSAQNILRYRAIAKGVDGLSPNGPESHDMYYTISATKFGYDVSDFVMPNGVVIPRAKQSESLYYAMYAPTLETDSTVPNSALENAAVYPLNTIVLKSIEQVGHESMPTNYLNQSNMPIEEKQRSWDNSQLKSQLLTSTIKTSAGLTALALTQTSEAGDYELDSNYHSVSDYQLTSGSGTSCPSTFSACTSEPYTPKTFVDYSTCPKGVYTQCNQYHSSLSNIMSVFSLVPTGLMYEKGSIYGRNYGYGYVEIRIEDPVQHNSLDPNANGTVYYEITIPVVYGSNNKPYIVGPSIADSVRLRHIQMNGSQKILALNDEYTPVLQYKDNTFGVILVKNQQPKTFDLVGEYGEAEVVSAKLEGKDSSPSRIFYPYPESSAACTDVYTTDWGTTNAKIYMTCGIKEHIVSSFDYGKKCTLSDNALSVNVLDKGAEISCAPSQIGAGLPSKALTYDDYSDKVLNLVDEWCDKKLTWYGKFVTGMCYDAVQKKNTPTTLNYNRCTSAESAVGTKKTIVNGFTQYVLGCVPVVFDYHKVEVSPEVANWCKNLSWNGQMVSADCKTNKPGKYISKSLDYSKCLAPNNKVNVDMDSNAAYLVCSNTLQPIY